MNIKQPDIILIRRLKKGDLRAFDAIYKRYSKRLYFFVFRYVKQKEDAEEIVQEVFLKIWEFRRQINLKKSFEAFIFTIAYNSTITLLRKRINEKRYLDKLRSIQQTHHISKAFEMGPPQEIYKEINTLLDKLTPRQKEIFSLSREQGLTHAEIAEKLNISSNTVKNHLVKALADLKTEASKRLNVSLFFVLLTLV